MKLTFVLVIAKHKELYATAYTHTGTSSQKHTDTHRQTHVHMHLYTQTYTPAYTNIGMHALTQIT